MKSTAFVLLSIALTAISWGAYGPLLALGGRDMAGSHWLPFLFVGVAYFAIAVVATAALLAWRGEPGNWSTGGVIWSFLAGVVTAVGALCVILALTNRGNPIYVMPLVFGGAPVVNTLVTMWTSKAHREAGPFFYAGLILVIAGSTAVLVFNPASHPKSATPSVAASNTQTTVDAQPAPQSSAMGFPQLMKVLGFVALTAICWGCYGPLLHIGQMKMHGSRMRPFICIGLAYVVVAVIAPLVFWTVLGADGELSARGVFWSVAGGTAGALGSLGVILAFTFGGKPVYVMPLIFGGAPVINTFISIVMSGNISSISPFFYAGLIVVVAGAISVLVFAPRGAPAPHPATAP